MEITKDELIIAYELGKRNFEGVVVNHTAWTHPYLRQSVFRGATFLDCCFDNGALDELDLSHTVIKRTRFENCNMTGAKFNSAQMEACSFYGSRLDEADFSGADLRTVGMRLTCLSGALFDNTLLPEGYDIPMVPDIDLRLFEELETGRGELETGSWHVCATTHCRAGWAVVLGGRRGRALENLVGSSAAGGLIYAKSRPGERVPNFYDLNCNVLWDIRACADRQAKVKQAQTIIKNLTAKLAS